MSTHSKSNSHRIETYRPVHTNIRSVRQKRRQRRLRFRTAFIFFVLLFLSLLLALELFSGGGTRSKAALGAREASAAVREYANDHNLKISDYPQDLLDLYARNPETEKFVLEYPERKDQPSSIDLSQYQDTSTVPLLMQWDQQWGYETYSGNLFGLTGCGPTCLSMVAIYLSGDTTMNPAWMGEFATQHGYVSEGNGSAWTLFSEGGRELGFDVTEIPLDEQRIIKNLQVGNPIVVSMGKGDFTTTGHFIVMTGYTDGKIQVNDPNSRANSEKLWSFDNIKGQIKNLWVFR